MRLTHILLSGFLFVAAAQASAQAERNPMPLGNFSLSLMVRDVNASKAFYEKLGFTQVLGDTAQGWAIMKSGSTNIGLFQDGVERNMLTFNPGWDQDANPTGAFTDVRLIQQRLREAGLDVGTRIESASGPASFRITDPDGNPILFDQHR